MFFRKCPCCGENISVSFLFQKRNTGFITCSKCNKTIGGRRLLSSLEASATLIGYIAGSNGKEAISYLFNYDLSSNYLYYGIYILMMGFLLGALMYYVFPMKCKSIHKIQPSKGTSSQTEI